MSYIELDMEKYPRRNHFNYFRTLAYPYVGTTAEVDVTDLYCYSKKNNRSFYLTFMHAVALAADQIPEFRQRIRGEGIAEYSESPTSHIELMEDTTYRYCTLRHHMDLDSYFEQAVRAQAACKGKELEEDTDVESMYFISTLPWINYTSLIQPVAGGDDSNPRFTWGKYEVKEDGRVMMPVSVLAHHALVDGIHIAQFYKELEKQIAVYS